MEKEKRSWKFFSWNTACVIAIACALNTIIWLALHGIPLAGLPEKENVQSITIVCNGTEERQITDGENIELLVKAANLLNYRLAGQEEGSPVITVAYHLKDGEDAVIAANGTTVWWKGKAHALKEPELFSNIMQGLFFYAGEN